MRRFLKFWGHLSRKICFQVFATPKGTSLAKSASKELSNVKIGPPFGLLLTTRIKTRSPAKVGIADRVLQ
jgi:hypothetical protein